MLKIGEFARVGQVSIATLRHYDQYGLLKPTVLDQETGYRYYTLDQLPRLNRILALKDLGFPLEQIASFLKDDLSLAQLQGMLMLKQTQTQQMIDTERARLTRIAARLYQIEQEGKMPTYEVLLKHVEALHIASIRMHAAIPLQTDTQRLYATINAYLDQQHIPHTQPSILLLHSRSEQREDGIFIDVEAAIPVPTAFPVSVPSNGSRKDGSSNRLLRGKYTSSNPKRSSGNAPGNEQITIRTLPAGLVASTVHTGHDLSTGQAHAALYRWMKDNNYRIIAPPRQVHLQRGEHMSADQYVTEVQFPVEKI